jgi:hypothetical protein
MVFLVFAAIEGEGDDALRLTPEILAAGLGCREATIERIMVALASLGVTCDGVVTEEWRAADRGPSMKGSAPRTRKWRERKRNAGLAPAPAPNADPGLAPVSQSVTGDAAAPSYSLFPVDQASPQKEQKKTRTHVESNEDGFAALVAMWPLSNRMAEAEREYRRYRQHRTASEILMAAQRYIETKEEWRSAQFLMNWLRTDPCKDPVLPLASAPCEVPAEPKPLRENWINRLAELRSTGVWPVEWGARWGEPQCRIPPDTGIAQGFAKWFAEHANRHSGEQISA